MKKLIYLLSIVTVVLIVGCEDYINSVDPLIDRVADDRLSAENQMRFQIVGVQQNFSVISSQLGCQMDLLSDALDYSNLNPDASYPQFEEINRGIMALNNTSVQATWNAVHYFRFLADTLGDRASKVDFTSAALKNEVLFTSNFYGGLARLWLATSFAMTEKVPGACYNTGPFVPASQILDEAVAKLKAAITYAPDAYNKKVANSVLAKIYLAKLDYANCATYAAQGMVSGDNSFNALNAETSNIYFWGFAGNGRKQIHVADRFNDYITADAKEANRIKIASFKFTTGETHYYQVKYANRADPYVVMTWQETALMLAECALRGQGTSDAKTLVNSVRSSHSIDPLSAVTLDAIYTERDKELFCQGNRMMDQLRYNRIHLPDVAWRYLPIPQSERDANPNF